jgi:hypothetical protein
MEGINNRSFASHFSSNGESFPSLIAMSLAADTMVKDGDVWLEVIKIEDLSIDRELTETHQLLVIRLSEVLLDTRLRRICLSDCS